MGLHVNIRHDKFPNQGNNLNKRVKVCFHYDSKHTIEGTIVRDDKESPGECLIKLDNGKYVRAVECQYQIIDKRYSEEKPVVHRSKGIHLEKYKFLYYPQSNTWRHENGSMVREDGDGYSAVIRISDSGIKQYQEYNDLDEDEVLNLMRITSAQYPMAGPTIKRGKGRPKKNA